MADIQNPNSNQLTDLESNIASLKGEKAWAISCYIPVFNIVSCVLTSIKMVTSKFCLFHAKQGLVLFFLWFLTIVIAIVSPMLSMMLWGVVLMLHVVGVVLAYQMKLTEIPVVSKFAAKIPDDFVFKYLTGKKVDTPPAPKV